jgi:carbonic anhydrase
MTTRPRRCWCRGRLGRAGRHRQAPVLRTARHPRPRPTYPTLTHRIPPHPLQANEAYASSFTKGDLALPPARRAALLVCMDARIDPAKALGLQEGDAHVIRNAGGRVSDDAVRSFVISHKLLGTNEWFIVQHTDCGMLFFTSELMGTLLSTSLSTAGLGDKGFYNKTEEGGAVDGKYINWLTISNLATSVTEDVTRLAGHPLVAPGIPVHGFIYDVKTGKVAHVVSKVSRTA